jgi:hypothetical protein
VVLHGRGAYQDLYFYGQLYTLNSRDIFDEEGDFVETVADEDALMLEAEQFACDFMVSHMRPDSRYLPTYEGEDRTPQEYGVGHLGVPHTSE